MYRIRFHGRGGQGMKTAANILGAAFFDAGYEVQDAPRYGAERRGAPMVAYVRAARAAIVERGAIAEPDLVVVADTTLLVAATAGVMQGASSATVMFVNSLEPACAVQAKLRYPGRVATWPHSDRWSPAEPGAATSAMCAGAAARMIGAIPRDALERSLVAETASRGTAVAESNRLLGLGAYDAMECYVGIVTEGGDQPRAGEAPVDWIRLAVEDARIAVPDVFTPASSERSNTGLWRTSRPVIDYAHCNRCSWVCSTLCPDSAIRVDAERTPRIDYDHCKGCMICLLACPPHAIRQVPEHVAQPSGAAK